MTFQSSHVNGNWEVDLANRIYEPIILEYVIHS